MRIFALALALVLATPGFASAQTASSTPYSSATTEIGVLLDDPAARSMTMKDIQQYSPAALTDKLLAAIDADFAKLPTKK